MAIQLIQQPCKDTQTHYFIIQECTSIIHNKDRVVKIKHCFREINKAADYLANSGVSQSEPMFVYNPPPPPYSPSSLRIIWCVCVCVCITTSSYLTVMLQRGDTLRYGSRFGIRGLYCPCSFSLCLSSSKICLIQSQPS